MKNILFLALLSGIATVETAQAQTAPATQPGRPMTKEERKVQRQKLQQKAPEVYKGSVAEQVRIVREFPGAEKEKEMADEETARKAKKRKE